MAGGVAVTSNTSSSSNSNEEELESLLSLGRKALADIRESGESNKSIMDVESLDESGDYVFSSEAADEGGTDRSDLDYSGIDSEPGSPSPTGHPPSSESLGESTQNYELSPSTRQPASEPDDLMLTPSTDTKESTRPSENYIPPYSPTSMTTADQQSDIGSNITAQADTDFNRTPGSFIDTTFGGGSALEPDEPDSDDEVPMPAEEEPVATPRHSPVPPKSHQDVSHQDYSPPTLSPHTRPTPKATMDTTPHGAGVHYHMGQGSQAIDDVSLTLSPDSTEVYSTRAGSTIGSSSRQTTHTYAEAPKALYSPLKPPSPLRAAKDCPSHGRRPHPQPYAKAASVGRGRGASPGRGSSRASSPGSAGTPRVGSDTTPMPSAPSHAPSPKKKATAWWDRLSKKEAGQVDSEDDNTPQKTAKPKIWDNLYEEGLRKAYKRELAAEAKERDLRTAEERELEEHCTFHPSINNYPLNYRDGRRDENPNERDWDPTIHPVSKPQPSPRQQMESANEESPCRVKRVPLRHRERGDRDRSRSSDTAPSKPRGKPRPRPTREFSRPPTACDMGSEDIGMNLSQFQASNAPSKQKLSSLQAYLSSSNEGMALEPQMCEGSTSTTIASSPVSSEADTRMQSSLPVPGYGRNVDTTKRSPRAPLPPAYPVTPSAQEKQRTGQSGPQEEWESPEKPQSMSPEQPVKARSAPPKPAAKKVAKSPSRASSTTPRRNLSANGDFPIAPGVAEHASFDMNSSQFSQVSNFQPPPGQPLDLGTMSYTWSGEYTPFHSATPVSNHQPMFMSMGMGNMVMGNMMDMHHTQPGVVHYVGTPGAVTPRSVATPVSGTPARMGPALTGHVLEGGVTPQSLGWHEAGEPEMRPLDLTGLSQRSSLVSYSWPAPTPPAEAPAPMVPHHYPQAPIQAPIDSLPTTVADSPVSQKDSPNHVQPPPVEVYYQWADGQPAQQPLTTTTTYYRRYRTGTPMLLIPKSGQATLTKLHQHPVPQIRYTSPRYTRHTLRSPSPARPPVVPSPRASRTLTRVRDLTPPVHSHTPPRHNPPPRPTPQPTPQPASASKVRDIEMTYNPPWFEPKSSKTTKTGEGPGPTIYNPPFYTPRTSTSKSTAPSMTTSAIPAQGPILGTYRNPSPSRYTPNQYSTTLPYTPYNPAAGVPEPSIYKRQAQSPSSRTQSPIPFSRSGSVQPVRRYSAADSSYVFKSPGHTHQNMVFSVHTGTPILADDASAHIASPYRVQSYRDLSPMYRPNYPYRRESPIAMQSPTSATSPTVWRYQSPGPQQTRTTYFGTETGTGTNFGTGTTRAMGGTGMTGTTWY